MNHLTRRRAFFAGVAVVLLALGLLIATITGLESDDNNRHMAGDYLRHTAELEYRLREALLEAHAFRLETYDPIVEVTQQIEETCPTFERNAEVFLASYSPKVKSSIAEYCRLSKKALESVEAFKSKNSLLRNSIKYFPIIISTLKEPKYRSYALDIYDDILLYCLQPKESSMRHIQHDLDGIPALVKGREVERIQMATLETHAKVVLATAAERQNLEDELYSPEIEIALASLNEAYVVGTDQVELRSKYVKAGAIGFSTFLLLALVALLYRLQTTAESISALNANLEEKVEERTGELKQALSELELQQQMLAHSTKMSALGEMAGGIAHEINTPLAAISLKAESLLLDEQPAETVASLNEIIGIVERVAKIVLGLRRFSRTEQNQPFTRQLVSTIVDDTLILCSQKFQNHGVKLQVEVDRSLAIDCLPEQIAQVILNLLNNAFDAVMPLPQKWVAIKVIAEADQVAIFVSDSGAGISADLQAKIMQPFFTTKDIGKGTGIGLSISQGIIAKHGGHLTYDVTATNTTFKIVLPEATAYRAVA